MEVATETQIKASDLRINNFVLHEGKMYRVTWRDLGFEKVNLEPIPLTTEILEKCDFDYIDKYTCIIKNWCFKRSFGGTGLIFHYEHHSNPVSRQATLVYVHQLQNFFHLITGEELIITL